MFGGKKILINYTIKSHLTKGFKRKGQWGRGEYVEGKSGVIAGLDRKDWYQKTSMKG